jgi:hypothetical protein
MSRSPSAFRQSDVTKAILGAQKAGMAVTRFEIFKDGRIVIVTSKSDDASFNEWDEVFDGAPSTAIRE